MKYLDTQPQANPNVKRGILHLRQWTALALVFLSVACMPQPMGPQNECGDSAPIDLQGKVGTVLTEAVDRNFLNRVRAMAVDQSKGIVYLAGESSNVLNHAVVGFDGRWLMVCTDKDGSGPTGSANDIALERDEEGNLVMAVVVDNKAGQSDDGLHVRQKDKTDGKIKWKLLKPSDEIQDSAGYGVAIHDGKVYDGTYSGVSIYDLKDGTVVNQGKDKVHGFAFSVSTSGTTTRINCRIEGGWDVVNNSDGKILQTIEDGACRDVLETENGFAFAIENGPDAKDKASVSLFDTSSNASTKIFAGNGRGENLANRGNGKLMLATYGPDGGAYILGENGVETTITSGVSVFSVAHVKFGATGQELDIVGTEDQGAFIK